MQINENKEYSLNELVRMQVIPNLRSRQSYRNLMWRDMANKNILQPRLPKRQNEGYLFKGENVKKFIDAYEHGYINNTHSKL